MATNHHAMIRYQALDKCFRNHHRKYYIDDLVEACCEAIYNNQGIKDGVKRRQVWKDIAFMESPEGWEAPIEHIKDGKKVYFRYADEDFSINKQPLSQEEISKLKDTIYMLSRFKGMAQSDWIEEIITRLESRFDLNGSAKGVIEFEQNLDYVGARHLSDIFNAIVNRQPLYIEYRKFTGEDRSWLLHPYYIRQYNGRWFLYGLNSEMNVISNIPLDRITSFKTVDCPYIDTNIDFSHYFDDVIGATLPDAPTEDIILKFAPERFPYVQSKPIHLSMTTIDKENCIVRINVIPNRELEAMIFSFGNQVEVLAPQWFREQVGDKIKELSQRYSK